MKRYKWYHTTRTSYWENLVLCFISTIRSLRQPKSRATVGSNHRNGLHRWGRTLHSTVTNSVIPVHVGRLERSDDASSVKRAWHHAEWPALLSPGASLIRHPCRYSTTGARLEKFKYFVILDSKIRKFSCQSPCCLLYQSTTAAYDPSSHHEIRLSLVAMPLVIEP